MQGIELKRAQDHLKIVCKERDGCVKRCKRGENVVNVLQSSTPSLRQQREHHRKELEQLQTSQHRQAEVCGLCCTQL